MPSCVAKILQTPVCTHPCWHKLGPDSVNLVRCSSFAMIRVGCITRESVSMSLGPAALGHVNHVEASPYTYTPERTVAS